MTTEELIALAEEEDKKRKATALPLDLDDTEALIAKAEEVLSANRAAGGKPENEPAERKHPFEAIYPRTKAALEDVGAGKYKSGLAAVPRVTGALISDELSAAGRAIASLPALMPGGESFGEAMERTRGKERGGMGNVAQIAGDIVRSPATALGGLAGGAVRGAATRALGGVLGKATGPAAKVAGAVVGNVAEGLPYLAGRQIERVGEGQGISPGEAGIDVAQDIAMPLLGMAGKKLLTKGVPALAKATGEGVEATGKSALRSAMKIKDVTAKKAGRNVEEGAQKIIDDIAKYKVQSPAGGFKGIAKNSVREIEKAKTVADDIIEKAKIDPAKKMDIDGTFLQFMDELQNGGIDAIPVDEIDRAVKITGEIADALKKHKGIYGEIDIATANEAKKAIAKGVFKKGAPQIMDDPLKNKVKELISLRIRDEIEKHVPEIRPYNQKIHDLLNVKLAADEAAKRQQNWNVLTMSDLIIGGAGGGASAISQSPETAIGTAALLLANRALRAGRGPSALISAGKMLKGNRGSIGGIPERLRGLTPAIKSPTSGKIYTTDAIGFGHKKIMNEISKAEPEAEKLVWRALFDDNTGRGSEYIGFVDKMGRYISRIDAEKEIERAQSGGLAAIYHEAGNSPLPMTALTGLGAGAALAGGTAIERALKSEARQKAAGQEGKSGLRIQQEDEERELEMLRRLKPSELRKIAELLERK